jgi:hypothetical protein
MDSRNATFAYLCTTYSDKGGSRAITDAATRFFACKEPMFARNIAAKGRFL